jgi:hypothetical protein
VKKRKEKRDETMYIKGEKISTWRRTLTVNNKAKQEKKKL